MMFRGGGRGSGAAAFPRFDVADDASDHSYLTTKKKDENRLPNISKDAPKKIMREWKILEKHLPDSISVRVYANRIDLMTAVIVGSPGTPYHDGLYFFDIRFSPDYPNSLPWVRYRSYGMRINPNLYASGRVCLSLINTWEGRSSSEKWIPGKSTILQLLISIQGLVQNEKPYYNEPYVAVGEFWGELLFGGRPSSAYSEDAYLLCCKTMLHLMRKPPRNFESFVRSHFRERGFGILAAMMAYRNGECRVGYYGIGGGGGSSVPARKGRPSRKFKAGIKELVPQLATALAKTGASVGNFVEQLEGEKVGRGVDIWAYLSHPALFGALVGLAIICFVFVLFRF
ncbi:unnamed protein product [Linum trigynum]|uniref:UBC core domain-containing protein n=1 Tax=Linum trigynum TaxID=586398 RepID=A0AAV2FGR8_9ROSI